MDWNSKWDRGNAFGLSPRKMQLVDWMIVGDGGHVASASNDSSVTSRRTVEGFPENLNKKMQIRGAEISRTCPHLVSSAETFIGLKLGKRTYFENNSAGGNVKTASIPVPSTTSFKKTKSSRPYIHVPRCVVEGCNVDLSMAKEYHRKHRVCGSHSKCPKVIVGGLERRFCQQCSRFHDLSEFDEAKRSCRRRLSDHNARRRKPQQETIQFNSTTRQSMLSYYGERLQLSFLLNNRPLTHSRDSVDTTWNSTCNSKFTLTKGYPLKFTGEGGISELMHMPGANQPHVVDIHGNAQLLASKSSVTEVLSSGSKISPVCSQLDPAPEYHRALSLLSFNNCGPCAPETMPAAVHEIGTCAALPMMHTTQEGSPLSSPEFWLAGDQTPSPQLQSLASNNNFWKPLSYILK